MSVPTNLLASINGIAVAAKAAGDANAISICEQIAQMADFGLGGTPAYYSAATSTTQIVTATSYPAGSITPSFDSANSVSPGAGMPGSLY